MSHRRRGVGVGRSGVAKKQYSKKAEEIKASSFQSALETVEKLRLKLSNFAKHHQAEIQGDPAFRQQFLQMCAPLGVDPLMSRRSFWSKTLGVGMGDYYFELAVKIAEVCFATRSRNGGIIALSEMHEILSRKKTVHRGDIPIAVDKLKSLGAGFRVIEVGMTAMIVSVPTELDLDHIKVFSLAESGEGCITTDDIVKQLAWNQERAERVIKLLLSEGMAWEDNYHGLSFFWFPSVWKEQCQAKMVS